MLNKVTLIGNMGDAAEIRTTQAGKQFCTFSLATSESYKNKDTGERDTKTEWHNVVIFSEGLVGVVENYTHKGSKLYIEGQLQTRKYTDEQGVDRYSTQVVLNRFNSKLVLLDSKGEDTGTGKPKKPKKAAQAKQQYSF